MINRNTKFASRSRLHLCLHQAALVAVSTVLWSVFPVAVSRAESAIPLLIGFDEARIGGILGADPIQPNVAELAKFIFRVDKVDSASLEGIAQDAAASAPLRLGDGVMLKGKVRSVERINVPEALAELLDFKQFYWVEVESNASSDPDLVNTVASVDVYVKQIPVGLKSGDSISAGSVVIGLEGEGAALKVLAVAASRLRWTPEKLDRIGLKLLAHEGVDIGGVSALASRNRQSLQSADSDSFYTMMAAATSIASKSVPQAESVRPAVLLQEPEKRIGDWVRLEVETIRVTRIAVTEPLRQQQLGGDEYFQVDAIGDLGNVVIELQRPEGAPVRFENRFPVSIVMEKLPEFLARKMQRDGGESVGVQLISSMVQVDGFFFRLWSYENDRMNQDGQGEQIGPLVVASSMTSLEISGSDPIGVYKIGYIAASGVIIGLALVWWWTQSNRLSDSVAHASRSQHPAPDVTWLKDDPSGEETKIEP